MDQLDLLAVQGALKSLLQHHSSKASILQHSAFFIVQLSHPYMPIEKTIALTRQISVGKVISLLFNMLSMLVISFLPRSKRLLISWLQSRICNPSAVIMEPPKIVCHSFLLFQEDRKDIKWTVVENGSPASQFEYYQKKKKKACQRESDLSTCRRQRKPMTHRYQSCETKDPSLLLSATPLLPKEPDIA